MGTKFYYAVLFIITAVNNMFFHDKFHCLDNSVIPVIVSDGYGGVLFQIYCLVVSKAFFLYVIKMYKHPETSDFWHISELSPAALTLFQDSDHWPSYI